MILQLKSGTRDFPYLDEYGTCTQLVFASLIHPLSGKTCFVCDIDGTRHSIDNLSSCPSCPAYPLNKPQKLLMHATSHILYDDGLSAHATTCGYCLSDLCVWYLKHSKASGMTPRIDLQRTTCPNYARDFKFSYKSSASFNQSSPCSNVPLTCPCCPPNSPAVWKLNMAAHLNECYPSAADTDLQQFQITNFERQALKTYWSKRIKIPQTRKHRTSEPPLVISDAHRAWMALRYG